MRSLILTSIVALVLMGTAWAQCTFTMPTSGSSTQDLTACCSSGATFLDSGGDNAYGNNENGIITFTAPAGNQIEVRFDSFRTEEEYDTLWVYDGNSTSAPLLAILNGAASGPFRLRSSGNQVTFRFKSDGSIVYRGWRARLSCVDPAAVPLCMFNMSTQTVNLQTSGCCGGAGFFDSGGPSANYGDTEDDTITFQAPSGRVVRVYFGPSFRLASGDTLYVYDGQNLDAPLIAKLSGTSTPVSYITSSGEFLTFRFVSNASGNHAGWIAMAECFTPTACDISMPPAPTDVDLQAIGCCGGANFYDSGGPGDEYGDNENRVITFTAPSGQYVQLQFNSFNTEVTGRLGYDIVYVYDGPSRSSRQIAALTGNIPAASLPTITSTGNSLTVQFISDGSIVRSGWNARVSCVATQGTPPCVFFVPPNTKNEVNLTALNCCDAPSIIYDSGGDSGRVLPDARDTLILRVNSGSIQLRIDTLNIGPATSRDTLFIYDGDNTSAPVLQRRVAPVSPSNPLIVNGTTTAMMIVYRGLSGFSKFGWKAQATCQTSAGVAKGLSAIRATLYPNPSAGTSVLEASQALVRVRIWDLQGRLVWEGTGDSPRWELTSPAKGIFLVEGWTRSGEPVRLRWVVE